MEGDPSEAEAAERRALRRAGVVLAAMLVCAGVSGYGAFAMGAPALFLFSGIFALAGVIAYGGERFRVGFARLRRLREAKERRARG
ncbi:hypothetical protein [Rubritepida flocculans]|uniref:hypothetical protein n=1 Tax=Rubritepida flocculans TaxID=182403 RepID=UPI0012EBF4C9|nr:hypothetical protein [Rubritepida flocculans]